MVSKSDKDKAIGFILSAKTLHFDYHAGTGDDDPAIAVIIRL